MLFSILVPVHNTELYLDECISSLLGQTEQDFEIILINDGSTDSSGIICDKYARSYPDKVKIYHQKNKGALLTRKLGIINAHGDFCIFVDSDDYLRVDALQIIKKTIIKHNCDLIIYNYVKILKNGDYIKIRPIFKSEDIFEGDNKKKLYSAMLTDDLPGFLCIKAVKRSIIDIEYDYAPYSYVSVTEDLLQSLPIMTNSKKAIYINEHLYFYRYNPKSIGQTFKPHQYRGIRAVAYKLCEYFNCWELGEEDKINLHRRNIIAIVSAVIRIGYVDNDLSKKQEIAFLDEVANDSFFLNSLNSLNKSELGLIYNLYCKMLAKHKYKTVLFISKLACMVRLRELKQWIHYKRLKDN